MSRASPTVLKPIRSVLADLIVISTRILVEVERSGLMTDRLAHVIMEMRQDNADAAKASMDRFLAISQEHSDRTEEIANQLKDLLNQLAGEQDA